ncbi:hypothetical protein GCM10017788_59810 [Amycolatopsis acidiphila]|nr:hypothetical protein GCM10017788_59810 [Amycolatopsis acidiphila]
MIDIKDAGEPEQPEADVGARCPWRVRSLLKAWQSGGRVDRAARGLLGESLPRGSRRSGRRGFPMIPLFGDDC